MNPSLLSWLGVLPLLPATVTLAQSDGLPEILPMRKRAQLHDRWLGNRLDSVVPMLMRREGIDCWVLVAREYNEDPVVETMLPAKWLRARRRTILVFHDAGSDPGVQRYAVARYAVGELFPGAWDKAEEPDQWKCLAELLAELDPSRIALNVSEDFALADGMAHSEHESLVGALSPALRTRIVSGQALALGWLETRTEMELAVYPEICEIAHIIISEGYESVRPGVTTTADLEWWYRERVAELKLDTWFHPSASVQRHEAGEHSGSFASRPDDLVILPGDLVHIDFGITNLGLNTDTQQHAYVLRPGETRAPEGLRKAMRVGNRLQDILMENFVRGRTGNEILHATIERAREEGIEPTIYTHPLGFHGHGAGPTIGLWDQQGGVPGKGDYPLYERTAHSIELNAAVSIPSWDDQIVRIMLEEDAYFDGERTTFLDGRQEELILIGPRSDAEASGEG